MKYKNIQNDNIKTQQTNNLTNTQAKKQTNTLTNTKIGVVRGDISSPRSNQPIEPPCSSTFCYSVWCNTTVNHPLKLPQQDFSNLYSIFYVKMFIQLWACQAVGTNHHHCSSIFTIQGNIIGVICRVVTPKDKERYPSPLTK